MSHEVETMAYANELPWHGLGNNLGARSDVKGMEMQIRAGLDWEVELQPIFLADGTKVEGQSAVVRPTTGSVFGVVGSYYRPVQNDALFGVPDVLVEEGIVSYETAASLYSGRVVFALAKMQDFAVTRIDGTEDPIRRYLLWTNRHDGSASVTGGFTDVRVVCKNTLDMALGAGLSNRFRIRHTASADERIKEAHRLHATMIANAAKQSAEYQVLAANRMAQDEMKDFAGDFLKEIAGEAKKIERRQAQVDELVNLFTTGTGNTGETLWDGYNAVTEWLDHKRRETRAVKDALVAQERHLESTLSGVNYERKGKARALLLRRAR